MGFLYLFASIWIPTKVVDGSFCRKIYDTYSFNLNKIFLPLPPLNRYKAKSQCSFLELRDFIFFCTVQYARNADSSGSMDKKALELRLLIEIFFHKFLLLRDKDKMNFSSPALSKMTDQNRTFWYPKGVFFTSPTSILRCREQCGAFNGTYVKKYHETNKTRKILLSTRHHSQAHFNSKSESINAPKW